MTRRFVPERERILNVEMVELCEERKVAEKETGVYIYIYERGEEERVLFSLEFW